MSRSNKKAFSVAMLALQKLAADPDLDQAHREELQRGIRELQQIDRKRRPDKVKVAVCRLVKVLWEITRKDR